MTRKLKEVFFTLPTEVPDSLVPKALLKSQWVQYSFERALGDIEAGACRRLLIGLVSDGSVNGDLWERADGIYETEVRFSYSAWEAAKSEPERRLMAAKAMLDGCENLATWAHISKTPFKRAYDKVIALAPPYEEIGKRKAWAPDRRHYAVTGFQFSEDKIDVFVAIFRRGPVEVDRRVFFTAFPSVWVAPMHVVALEWRDSAIDMLCKPYEQMEKGYFQPRVDWSPAPAKRRVPGDTNQLLLRWPVDLESFGSVATVRKV